MAVIDFAPTACLDAHGRAKSRTLRPALVAQQLDGDCQVKECGLPTQTGGVYDLATGTWKPTTTMNAPKERPFHVATWTDKAMLVWGGGLLQADTFLGDGALYYP